MATNPAANALAGLLGSAAKWATVLGLGGSLLQTSMYNGARRRHSFVGRTARRHSPPPTRPPTLTARAVDGGEQAVLFDRLQGVLPDTKGEGTHFLVPWLQKAVVFDIRTRPRTISSVTGTKDLQQVNLTLRVLSRPDVGKLPKIYSVR